MLKKHKLWLYQTSWAKNIWLKKIIFERKNIFWSNKSLLRKKNHFWAKYLSKYFLAEKTIFEQTKYFFKTYIQIDQVKSVFFRELWAHRADYILFYKHDNKTFFLSSGSICDLAICPFSQNIFHIRSICRA